MRRAGHWLWFVCLLVGMAWSAEAKEPSSRATSAKASRATSGATARPRSKARPTSSPKQARPSAKRGTKPEAPLAEPSADVAKAVNDQPASEPATDVQAQAGGIKTITFKAQEIEGRLKAPQILYFLRRVRAEFDAQALGHRSFLLELSDTRRQGVLR